MRFQSETSVFKFLRRSVDRASVIVSKNRMLSKLCNYIYFNFIRANLEAYGKIDKQKLSRIYNYIDLNFISTNLEAYAKSTSEN